MAFTDSNNTIFETKFPTSDTTSFNFQLLENKRSGIIRLSVREFKSSTDGNGYNGPTKNGFMLKLESAEQIENLQKAFNDYFDEVKKHI